MALTDCSYVTALSTCFYDREHEIGELNSYVKPGWLTILYGPRGIGKSELVRYWLRRVSGLMFIEVDARAMAGGALLEALTLGNLGGDVTRMVREAISEILDLKPSLTRLLTELYWRLREALVGAPILFIDEFHLLPGYRGFDDVLRDLEILSALLGKNARLSRYSVVVTVSEGFIATSYARSKLRGYPASWILVEHMELESFKNLYNEYVSRKGCRLSLGIIVKLVGSTPGALPVICSMDGGELTKWIWERIEELERAILVAQSHLVDFKPVDMIKLTLNTLQSKIKPLVEPKLHKLGEILVEHNIAYPRVEIGGVRYIPQYPLYTTILELVTTRNLESLLELKPEEIINTLIDT